MFLQMFYFTCNHGLTEHDHETALNSSLRHVIVYEQNASSV